MCTVLDGDLADVDNFMENTGERLEKGNCLKCGTPETTLTLRGKDFYCTPCFIAACDHKFRASLGRRRLIRHGDNVLLLHAGGCNTTVMLDIVNNGLVGDLHKKFAFKPHILYIDKGAIFNNHIQSRVKMADEICAEMDKYPIPSYITTISYSPFPSMFNTLFHSFKSDYKAFLNNVDDGPIQNLLANINTLSAKQDLLKTLERNLYLKIAKKLKCSFVFTSESAADVANSTLTAFALGRGHNVTMDGGFSDNRDVSVLIARPMRDFTKEEIELYCKMRELQPISSICNQLDDVYSSIGNLTNKFIDDLHKNYPATVYTVIRTADKLVTQKNTSTDKCKLCKSLLDVEGTGKLSAVQAVEFSKRASHHSGSMSACNNFQRLPEELSISSSTKHSLCYACHLTLANIKN